MTTAAERSKAEREAREARLANIVYGLFVLDEGGREILADWQAQTQGSPGLHATGAATSAEFIYQTGYRDGRRVFVEDIEVQIARIRSPIARQTQAQEQSE